MTNFQKPKYTITPSGDYLQVNCIRCGDVCDIDFKGFDPCIVLIEITCPKCGSSGNWKLDKAGLGFYKYGRRRKRRRDAATPP
jgi:ribosomal protein S27E